MNDVELRTKLRQILHQIRHQGLHTDTGICGNVCRRFDKHGMPHETRRVIETMKELFRKWPEFSGNDYYPIPGIAGSGHGPTSTFHEHNGALWDLDTEYGRARWRLLDFMIDELEHWARANMREALSTYQVETEMFTVVPNSESNRLVIKDAFAAAKAYKELLAADIEFDEARAALREIELARGNWAVNPLPASHPAALRLTASAARRNEAIKAAKEFKL